jgi:hypothetical protein
MIGDVCVGGGVIHGGWGGGGGMGFMKGVEVEGNGVT